MANETELAELLIEIAKTLDENHEAISNLSEQINALTKRVDDLSTRLVKLEDGSNINKFKLSPVPDPIWPNFQTNKCRDCGIEIGPNNWGYTCSRSICPQRVFAYTTAIPSVGISTTCACGQNPTCQCNK